MLVPMAVPCVWRWFFSINPLNAKDVYIRPEIRVPDSKDVYIVYIIESAAYGIIFTSCLCENPNERGTSE